MEQPPVLTLYDYWFDDCPQLNIYIHFPETLISWSYINGSKSRGKNHALRKETSVKTVEQDLQSEQ